MKYLEWNNAIINHFFNTENEEKEVTLYFSEDVIREIGEKNFTLPEDGYVVDFFKALRNGVNGTTNNYIQRILDLESKYSQGCRGVQQIPLNYPPYLSYLLSFLLPFTSGTLPDGFRMTNFHDIVKLYFEERNLTTNYDQQIKFRLNEVDHLWNNIFDWLFESNNISLGYIEKIENPALNRKYVSKFEYHIIFRKEQEDKLSIIFDENNILPNEPIEEFKIKQLLIDNAITLRLTGDTVTKIRNNEYIGEKLVKRAFNYYKNWDGTNRYDYSKTSDSTTIQRGFSRKRIVLCLKFDILTQKIEVQHLRTYSIDGLPEEFTLTDITNKEFKNIEQCLQNPLYSTAITECFQNLNQNVELKDKSNRIKYTWKSKDFYLFKKDAQLNDWVEIPQIEFNANKTLIVAKRKFYDEKLKNWFEAESIPANHKNLYNDNTKNNLLDEWLALTIEQITKYQHPNLAELKTGPESTPKINFNKEFFFDACFYSDVLPDVWVENCEIESGEIVAEYNENTSIPLQKIESTFCFKSEHVQRKDQEFKLRYNNIEYPRFVKIIAFDKRKTNYEIEQTQPKRNLIGNSVKPYENPTNYFQGIEHHFNDETIRKMKPFKPFYKYSKIRMTQFQSIHSAISIKYTKEIFYLTTFQRKVEFRKMNMITLLLTYCEVLKTRKT
ncbi:MAG: hypothetical protein IPG55_05005 [Saprospiraceae bacterium]|nr:hypothetical protein [Candidatus Defluviibacterium haderslevense]